MRKAPKAGNHPAMRLGVVVEGLEGRAVGLGLARQQLGEGRHGALLAEQVFGMLQHQVAEHPFQVGQLAIPALPQPDIEQRLGPGITGKRGGRAPVNHASQLVQADQLGQPAVRLRCPVQLAAQGLLDPPAEALARLGILLGPVAKPQPVLARRLLARRGGCAEPPVEQRLPGLHGVRPGCGRR
ncbi:hypothetical protein D3C77_530050 [compost metagenome]